METISKFYPIFEGDQVLTANHLNSLRAYLEEQEMLTRSHLVGIGIVCGLDIANPDNKTIRISEGVGITSCGYLATLPRSDCRFICSYTDKEVEEVEEGAGKEKPGKYPFFQKGNPPKQIALWELLTEEEEKATDDPDIFPISLSAGSKISSPEGDLTVNFDDFYVLLYLEIDDEDLEDCFGDDCDEKGIRRNFRIRKLLVKKEALIEIIKKGRSGGSSLTEADLEAEINRCISLEEVCIERLGYSQGNEDLALRSFTSFNKLKNEYEKIIQVAASRVGHALYRSYEAFKPLLDDLYEGQNPFNAYAGTNGTNLKLRQTIERAFAGQSYTIQYQYDFLKDLIDAYDEFRETVCEVSTVCCPDPGEFSRHLMLGKAIYEEPDRRSVFRHYFQPSPVHTHQSAWRNKARLLFQRTVEMVKSLGIETGEQMSIKITPSKSFDEPLSRRSIPYYFNINTQNRLHKFWNFAKTSRFKSRHNLSYHANRYNKEDDCIVKPNYFHYNRYPFLRIEGHVGRNYEKALAELEGLREQLNLPVKIVGLKLGKEFINTRLTYECKFDDLQNLYKTFSTELKCLLEEEMIFFRNLKVKRETPTATPASSEKIPVEEKRIDTIKSASSEKGTAGYFDIKSEVSKYESYLGKSTSGFMYTAGFEPSYSSYAYQTAKEGTLGYYYDQMALSGKINYLDAIVSIDPDLLKMDPKILVFFFLKPARVANKIQLLLNKITEKLENLKLDELTAAYDALVQTAAEYKKDLKEPDDDLDGQEAMILYRLDKLIYSCSIKKLKELYNIYEDRVKEFKKLNLFANFAGTHSGMEHMAGVPKGGTFILVYIDQNEEREFFNGFKLAEEVLEGRKAIELSDIFKMYESGAYKTLSYAYTGKEKEDLIKGVEAFIREVGKTSAEKELGIGAGTLSELEKSLKTKVGEVSASSKSTEVPPKNIVVADFALPYLYKCECPELGVMVISQISFSLPETRFCKKDTGKYPFTMDPAGGVVESSAGGVSSEGNQYFFTPADAEPQGEDIQFTYKINNQTVVFNARIYSPVADFDFTTNVLEGGNVKVAFVNNSQRAQNYEWKFGDGQSSTDIEPVHIYKDFSKDKAIVTLKASKFDCSNEKTRSVPIPQEIPVEFDLEPSKAFGKNVYCNSDDQPYEFLTVPPGDPIGGGDTSGVFEQNGKFFFVPEDYKPGKYTFSYKGEKLNIEILEGPAKEFTFGVEDGDAIFTVVFTYKEEAESVRWIINDAIVLEGTKASHTFKKTEGAKHKIRLQVEKENGCTAVIDKIVTFDISPPEERETDITIKPGILDTLKDDTFDARLFEEENIIFTKTREILIDLKEDLKITEEREKLLKGEKNDEVAEAFRDVMSTSIAKIVETSSAGTGEEVKYLYNYYDVQVNNLLNLVAGQEKDIAKTGGMGKLLTEVDRQLKEMKDAGVEVDKDETLTRTVETFKLKAETTGKTNLVTMLDKINLTLKG